MLVKNVLALLVAGLAVATATNDTNTTATTAAAAAGNITVTTASPVMAGNGTATTAAATSGSTGAVTTAAATSGSTGAVTTAAATSGSTGAVTTAAASSGSTGVQSGTATTKAPKDDGGSSGGGQQNGTVVTDAPGSVSLPVEVKVLKFAIKGVKVSCPGGTCDDDSCGKATKSPTMIAGAKKVACASMLKDPANLAKACSVKITCDLSRRLRQLSGGNGTQKLVLDFDVQIDQTFAKDLDDVKDAVDLLTNPVNNKNPFVTKLLAESIAIGGSPMEANEDQTFTVVPAEPAIVVKVSGMAFSLHVYTGVTCGGDAKTITGMTGTSCVTDDTNSARVPSCTPGFVNQVTFKLAGTDCVVPPGTTPYYLEDNVCFVAGSFSMKLDCSKSVVASSTSDASSKSLVGVVFGLIMGFSTLM